MSMLVRSSSARALIRTPALVRYCASLEELKAGLVQVDRHRKVVRGTTMPKTLTDVVGSGSDLYKAADMTEMAVLTGMPAEHQNRTVVIQPRMHKTLQSGDKKSFEWQIVWKNSQRWSNPLMGWSSSADPMAQVTLSFDSKEDAVNFAKKNGWKYETRGRHAEANESVEAGYRIYEHNFLARRTKLELEAAKAAGKKSYEYEQVAPNKSNWFMMPTFHGDAEVVQHGDRAPPSKR